MKKRGIISLLIFLVLALNIFDGVIVQAEDYVRIIVNGHEIHFDVPPKVVNDRVLIQVRAIFEALDAEVFWDEETKRITAIKNGEYCVLDIDSQNLKTGICEGGDPDGRLLENDNIMIDVPAMQIDGRILVPLRAVSEAMRANVNWDEKSNTCNITTTENEEADGWIFYSNWSDSGRLYKIDTNGNHRKKLSDLDCYEIFYQDGWIYFYERSNRERLYRIDLNGENQQKLTEERIRVREIKDGFIYFTVLKGSDWVSPDFEIDGPLYKMKLDGSEKQLITDDIVNDLAIIDDTIYYVKVSYDTYTGPDRDLYKISINGQNKQSISSDLIKPDFWGNEIIKDDYLYFCNSIDGNNVWRINLEKGNEERITNGKQILSFSLMDDHIVYLDPRTIHIVDIDGNNDKQIIEELPQLFLEFEKNNRIYYRINDYTGNPYQYWSSDLNGEDRKKVFEANSHFKLFEDRIYFNKEECTNKTKIGLYSVDLEGNNKICFTEDFIVNYYVDNNRVYYLQADKNKLYRCELNGENKILVANEQAMYPVFVPNVK